MKKILYYLATSMLFLSLIVSTGCEDTGTTPDTKDPPLLTLGSASDVVDGGLLDLGTSGTVFLEMTGSKGTDDMTTLTFKENGANMDAARLSEAGGNIGSAVALLTGGNEVDFTWSVTITVPDVAGTYDYSVELADAGGLTDGISFTVNVGPTFADVMEVINGSTDHSTFGALLSASGLDATLTGVGPFTVFAPSDAAFGAVSGLADQLLNDAALAQEYLSNHIVDGTYLSFDLTDQLGLVSITGNDLTVANDGITISVNGATVELADFETGNGIVHFLSDVILPPGTPIDMTLTGVLFNKQDPATGRGSLDLDEGKGSGVTSDGDVPKEDAEIRDMGIDCTIDPAVQSNWRRQIGGFNGTELRVLDLSAFPEGFSFDGVQTKEEIQNAFDTGTPGTQQNSVNPSCDVTQIVDYTSDYLSVDDILVIKKADTYYLVRVDVINEDGGGGSPNTNTDNYELSIKY